MEDLGLVGDLAVVALAALAGGVLARLLRLPTILGYLAAGLVISPNFPGPSGDIEDVQTVADLGVALLMFTLGIRFSLRELNQYRALGIASGLGGTFVVFALGTVVGLAIGLETDEALVVGMVACISSTMVGLRLLEDRGALGAPEGRIAVVTALVQDMVVVVFLVLIPILAGGEDNVLEAIGIAVLKAAALLAGVWLVGTLVVPIVLARLAVSRSRELFLLSVVALALGTASVSFQAGLSLAFGAFLAGLLISESEYAHRTLSEVFPLREVFAVVFFVAIGMLIDLDYFIDEPGTILAIAGIAVLARVSVVTGISRLFGYPGKAALTAGVALAAMGEFSFVIVTQAAEEGLVDAALNQAILGAVLLSIASTPFLLLASPYILRALQAAPLLGPAFRPHIEALVGQPEVLVNHAVIVGYTESGAEVARALKSRNFRFLVIEEDPVAVRRLAAENIPSILGDPALPTVLAQAELERARVMIITLTDPGHVESVAALARRLNRRLDIVARAAGEESAQRLALVGVSQVVQSEFEVGMQFAGHALHRFGVSGAEIQAFLGRRRRDFMG